MAMSNPSRIMIIDLFSFLRSLSLLAIVPDFYAI
jgi:hypothetical protein